MITGILMRRRFDAMLQPRFAVPAACTAALVLGLLFTFVRAPHPWGHEGFDHYHDLALTVAGGRPFPTMEVPWAYAYFLAAFYRVFGDHPALPLSAQVLLNATVPALVFACAVRWFDRQVAAVAALLTGVLSFNTIYASTQSSDAVCTTVVVAAVLLYQRALERNRVVAFAVPGVLLGLAPQFRPNLILLAPLLAAFLVVRHLGRRTIAAAAALIGAAALVLTPWVVRNYRLTASILPTSVHGGVQLWYGTLQVGPYLSSRAYNPRSIFESPAFPYTSLDRVPLVIVQALKPCAPGRPLDASLTYWTDVDPQPRTAAGAVEAAQVVFSISPPRAPAAVYFFVTTHWPSRADGTALTETTPTGGPATPNIFFVSEDHLGDLDRHDDLLDIFDVVRAVRHIAWGEPVPQAARLQSFGLRGLTDIVDRMTMRFRAPGQTLADPIVEHSADSARLRLGDGSTITIPRAWRNRITDAAFDGPLAAALMTTALPLWTLEPRFASALGVQPRTCTELSDIQVNTVFYRAEPHMMHRYAALAFDNIARAPLAFAAASAYRALRLFVIRGSSDATTAQQFEGSRVVYTLASLASAIYLAGFVAGAVIAFRKNAAALLPLLLILYVPATIAPVLTNMRYTVTMQPFVFMFIACAVVSLGRARGWIAAPPAVPATSDRRTALLP